MTRPSALPLLLVTLWAEPKLWPPAAAARLSEVRALAQHAGLHTPEREHAVLTPDFRTFRRLLTTATPELERLPRGLELHWLLSLLEVELQLAEETQRRAHAVLHRARLFFPLDPTTRPFLATAPGGL